MRLIDSDKNNLYRKFLAQGSAREFKKTNWIVIEGLRQIEEALQASSKLEFLVFSDDVKGETILQRLRETSAELLDELDPDQKILLRSDLFLRLSSTKTPQGVLALMQPQRNTLKDIKPQNSLVLIDVQDPGNVGTLIRSADAFDIRQVIMLGATASPWSDKTLRAAMGSIFHLRVIEENDPMKALEELKAMEIELLALDLSGQDIRGLEQEKTYFALLLGNEGSGLPEEVLNAADRSIRIEMPGQAESLNVAMAGAIALYELSS
ncbi:MAG: RNA methyltransferase [Eubacteriales bacterium]|nr:RNA methyltransferase [Eubacteriales bacterium]MDD4324708.1 RNA methyltransferase [Eubacteriales bacterium]MDD4540556.1 RNA methyltransferase [Eubacteriales bacterium]